MSERGQHSGRGSGGGGRGGEHRGSRGGGRGAHQTNTERPKKENILDLGKYMDKKIIVKFNGGREGAYDGFLGCVQDVAFTYRPRKTLLARILAEAKYSYRYAKGLRCTYEFGAGRGMVLRGTHIVSVHQVHLLTTS